MQATSDLILIVEEDPKSVAMLKGVADHLGSDFVEAESTHALHQILSIRRPSVAILAIDMPGGKGLAAIRALAEHGAHPATVFIGSVDERVFASARRAGTSHGLTVVGCCTRPVDERRLERLLIGHVCALPHPSREELEIALSQRDLSLRYQPKIALAGGSPRIQGVEALVRWEHPHRGTLQPRHFLDAFEHYGLMTQLTDIVIQDAIRQAGDWQRRGYGLEMVVNLSLRLIQDIDFPARLAAVLCEHNVPPGGLVLDITEASLTEDRDLMFEVFTRLRILGVGISLDNFGTGSSSLIDLYRMPFSEIKVDASLISEVASEREAQLIVRGIADLAHSLDIAVCAAGVESRASLEFLLAANFDSAQGRLFCGPVKPADVEKLVSTWPGAALASTGSWRAPPQKSDEELTPTRKIRALRIG
jgi:EAL domain-containing protein (putative c-di-GMP-specific phosphodiesterase class I)